MLRSYRARFLLVHIGDPSPNQATTLESQMIHMIQEPSGQTLTTMSLSSARKSGASCELRAPSSRRKRSCGQVWGIDSTKLASAEKREVELAPVARLSSSVPSLRKASFAR